MPLPQPVKKDLEEFLDALAYLFATDPRTSAITWILGDVGMGAPTTLPFGYISQQSEAVKWMTSDGRGGSGGGLAAGLDDWLIPVIITVAFQQHQYVSPAPATPPSGSPFTAMALGTAVPYLEQPGWRTSLQTNQRIKDVLRTNIVVGGEVATTRITEARYILQVINSVAYRASRLTLSTQQRRVRGS
jgi:hypothetical protein